MASDRLITNHRDYPYLPMATSEIIRYTQFWFCCVLVLVLGLVSGSGYDQKLVGSGSGSLHISFLDVFSEKDRKNLRANHIKFQPISDNSQIITGNWLFWHDNCGKVSRKLMDIRSGIG